VRIFEVVSKLQTKIHFSRPIVTPIPDQSTKTPPCCLQLEATKATKGEKAVIWYFGKFRWRTCGNIRATARNFE
jgi:hypothetical protein